MSYAIRNDGQGWRAVGDAGECAADEFWQAEQPQPVAETPQQIILQKIDSIERQTLMNRATREFMLALAEQQGVATGLSPTQLYAANVAYRTVKDVDNQIVALRSKL